MFLANLADLARADKPVPKVNVDKLVHKVYPVIPVKLVYLANLALRDHKVLKVLLETQAHLVQWVHLVRTDKMEHLVKPVLTELMVKMVTTVKMVNQAHPVKLVPRVTKVNRVHLANRV